MLNIVDLPWLVPAPGDFASRCRKLGREQPATGADLQFLASHRLTPVQATGFRRAVARAIAADTDLAPLAPVRLAIVSNATMDFVADEIPAAAARHGVLVDPIVSPYDQVMQEALDPASATNAHKPDAILLAIDHRWLGIDRYRASDAAVRVADAIERIGNVIDLFTANSGATIILPLLPAPPAALFGSLERRVAGSGAAMIDAVNRAIVDLATDKGCMLLDVAALAARGGADRWFDPVQYAAYKLPFAAEFNGAYADMVGRLLGAMRGKARKCLVLDLDNTLWGGAIGDEGIDGIKLGAGSAVGEVFLTVQDAALDLKNRGVILAVASKNDDAVARSAFRDHPEMRLREADIVVFQANWTDKASNLEAIAERLSIGVDALVLLDDNPAERAQLRAALPQVAVPELPNDPAWFAWTLLSAGYFEAIAHSEEDSARTATYQANAERAAVQAKSRDLGDYLSSLEMKIEMRPFDAAGRARIAQLINKTNQFNLTTRRLTEAQVAAAEADESVVTIQARLQDRFGDMGMIGVIACRVEGATATIEDWLMSCRVLGRRVEEAMLTGLLARLREQGVSELRASYVPTAKNGMVREHFDKLGFTLDREGDDGRRWYCAEQSDFAAADLPMTLV